MVTPAYIDSLRTDALMWQPVDRAALEERLLAYLDEQLPDWNRRADSLLRRAVPLISAELAVFDEERLAQARRGLLAYATGPDLDLLGLGPPVTLRRPGESDGDYRVRIAESRLSISLGSLSYYEQRAYDLEPALTDALAVAAPNRQDVTLYGLTGDRQALTPPQVAALTGALNARDSVIAGVIVTVGARQEVPYTIEIEATYDAGLTDGADLEARIRAGVYAWLADSQRLGEAVYRSAIQEAAWVEGVLDIDLAAPAKDLAPPTLVFVAAADDPGSGAAGYVTTDASAPSGVGFLSAVVLTQSGRDYGKPPTARVTDDAGQTLDLTTTIEGGAVDTVVIPHPQTLRWYGYPTSTWGPLYTCASTAADVRITVTPKITPGAGVVNLTDEPGEVSIVAARPFVEEGSAVVFEVAITPPRRVDIEVVVRVGSTGPDYGIEAADHTVTIPALPAEPSIDLSLPTTPTDGLTDPATITAAVQPNASLYTIAAQAGSASTIVGSVSRVRLDVGAVESDVRRGEPARWTIGVYAAGEVKLSDRVLLSIVYDLEEGVAPTETRHILVDPSLARRTTVMGFVEPGSYDEGDALVAGGVSISYDTEADGPTGTLTMLMRDASGPAGFVIGGYVSGHPIGVTVQL